MAVDFHYLSEDAAEELSVTVGGELLVGKGLGLGGAGLVRTEFWLKGRVSRSSVGPMELFRIVL